MLRKVANLFQPALLLILFCGLITLKSLTSDLVSAVEIENSSQFSVEPIFIYLFLTQEEAYSVPSRLCNRCS